MVRPMIRPETLELIASGNLPPRELERLSPEVEADPQFEAVAGRKIDGDDLLNLLRTRIDSDALDPDDRVESLKSRLRELQQMLPREIRFPFLAPPQDEGEIGRLGIYRVRELLGEGGMGFVFLAEDPSLNRTVALKVMKPSIAALPDHRERFLREARNAAAVQSERVVPIYHIGEQGGVPFFAMPHLKGESLASRLNREPKLPLPEVLRIGREIAEGLSAAHEKGMIHRDVQPGNVWLEAPQDRVKLLDFGLSRNTSADVHLTQPGLMMGTPAFMAPEQARNREVDSRADLFSLGILLYRMATGESPFGGTDLISTLISVAVDEPNRPDVPPALSQLILQLLAKKAENRPASAAEVSKRLATIEADPHRTVISTEPRRHRPWGRFRVAFALLLFLLIGGFTTYQIFLKTENGTLVVDVSDPEVEARFKDGEVKLYDSKGELKYSFKPSDRNKTLPPGQYKITVGSAGNLKLDTDSFEIRNGDTVVVKVSLEGPTVASSMTKDKMGEKMSGEKMSGQKMWYGSKEGKLGEKMVSPSQMPEAKSKPEPIEVQPKVEKIDPIKAARHVAEWAIVQKGRVVVDVKGQLTEVALRSKLPDEPFAIHTLKYPESTIFDNETTRSIESLSRLDRIEFSMLVGNNSSESFLSWLAGRENRKLVRELAFNLPTPARASGGGSPFGGPGVGFGPPSAGVQSTTIDHLKSFPALKKVEFENASFHPKSFKSLGELAGLEELRLSNCGFENDWLYDLRGLKVKSLFLDGNPALSDEAVAELVRHKELVRINVKKTGLTGGGALEISLGLNNCNVVSDQGTFYGGKLLEPIKVDPQEAARTVVKWASENGGKVVVEQDDKRHELPGEYKLTGSPLLVVSIRFPDVRVLPDEVADRLLYLQSVERFEFDNMTTAVDLLQGNVRGLPREVLFTGCRVGASARGNPFDGKPLAGLKRVTFEQCRFAISKQKGFTLAEGIDLLLSLPALDAVVLRDCALQASHLPTIRRLKVARLSLDGNPGIDDECVPELLKMTSLKELSVKGTKITPAGLDRLKKALGETNVLGTATGDKRIEPQEARRAVLAWVLQHYGSACIRPEKGQKFTLQAGKQDRIPVGPFTLESLSISLPFDAPAEIVEAVEALEPFEHLSLYFGERSKTDLSHLSAKLCSLPRSLQVSNGRFQPESFEQFKRFAGLESLYFYGCTWASGGANGAMVEGLGKLPPVKKLQFFDCGAENYWIKGFKKLKLEKLDLQNNPAVTDAGIDALLELETLKELDVRRTGISREGSERLRLLRNCKVESDFGTIEPKK